ncbi:nicotinamide phosphoribosyltransferase-like [Macrobrachium rosenbergii]|uniref:nicotinamide phosphoribosyltransferase-like n=1 Tax=Macrobrachium rosenbergii TaxID=79674 RepID=UPI0034D504CA
MDIGPVNNIILLADCYKVAHHRLYPPGTTTLYSYFESRGGKFPYTVFFGLQYILKRWLVGRVVTEEVIQEAKEIFNATHMNEDTFNEEGWNHILKKHGGYLPVRIKAVAEGSVVPTRNVLFTVENTDPAVPWLTQYLETILVQTWYPMTVATISRVCKQLLYNSNERTSDDQSLLSGSLSDCGYRGASSLESAAVGGAAHLVNFTITQNIAGTCLLRKYYNVHGVPGYANISSEHSTVTTWGREEESAAHRNVMKTFFGRKVACVVDSYDIWKSINDIFCGELKDIVLQHKSEGGTLAIRPDSGDPKQVLLKCLDVLGKEFGTEKNSKGYKVLPSFMKVLQADGINCKSLAAILKAMEDSGWASNNAVFGAGAAILQKIDRDTQKCAYKCSLAVIDEKEREVFKQPIADPGKHSKRGRLALLYKNGVYTTVKASECTTKQDHLETVYENGKLLKDFSLEEIRERAQVTSIDTEILKFIEQDSLQ